MKQHLLEATRSWLPVGAPLALLLSLGCGGSSGTVQSGDGASSLPNGGYYISESNLGGEASDLILTRAQWGRLVDVFSLTASGDRVPVFEDFVIGEDVVTNLDYTLELNPVTSRESLTINRDVTDDQPAPGSSKSPQEQFFDLVQAAENNLTPIFDVGLEGSGVQSLVRRNAAIVLRFNDLLDVKSVTPQTIRVRVGVPPSSADALPFEARIVADQNHGGVINGQFYPTRVIIDPTISPLESFETDPPLPVNGVGLPPSVSVNTANIALRMPTTAFGGVGQSSVLQNLSGSSLGRENNGTVDFSTPTADVVRVMRSGGNSNITGDQYNGFLRDQNPPELIGSQPVELVLAPMLDESSPDPLQFIIPELLFLSDTCASAPIAGSVLTQPGIFAEVVEDAGAPGPDGTVTDVVVRLLLYPAEWDELEGTDGNGVPQGFRRWATTGSGQAQFLSIFNPIQDSGRAPCFATVIPSASGFPDAPTVGLATNATLGLRFSEPMDPASLTAFDSMTLTRIANASAPDEFVVGTVRQSLDLQSFTFIPDLDLAHVQGEVEEYFLTLSSGELGPVDLAGNQLSFELPQITASMDASASTRVNGGAVSRFNDADGEWGGQILFDLQRRLIRPRPLLRFDGVVDGTQLLPGTMTPFAPGVQTPLTKLGSKLQTVWRHADVGFSVTDNTNFNIDIEGLSWAPVGSQVTADTYEEFEIRLSHSRRLPDEYIDPDNLFPQHNKSGLVGTFAANVLGGEDQSIVHPAFRGYIVSPGDAYQSSTGTVLLPFPLNRTTTQEEATYFTWRDTSIRNRSGAAGNGAEIDAFYSALGLGDQQIGLLTKTYTKGQVRTVALPLLMEFRTYPDDNAVGLNAFSIRLAVNSSAEPYFRAFSTGGLSQNGEVTVDPDLETEANGGFNPGSNPPGASTYGRDPVIYEGSMDFVVRVSRAYSVWFPVRAGGNFLNFSDFNPPVLEPTPDQQPLGTDVDLDFRAAISVSTDDALENALLFDGYGDYYADPVNSSQDTNVENPGIGFYNGSNWSETVSEINGANYYQVRATFTANPITGLTPELSAVAVSWQEQN